MKSKLLMSAALAIAGIFTAAPPSLATPVTYTEQSTASGSLNGVPFTNASFLLTEINDTANIMTFGTEVTITGTATLSIGGGPAVTFTDMITVADNHIFTQALFADNLNVILADTDALFATYALATSIGPVTANGGSTSLGHSFATSGGPFILTSFTNGVVTFTADVPEPSSVALLGTALAGLGLLRRRRKRQN